MLSKRGIILTCAYTHSSPSPSKGPTSKKGYSHMTAWISENLTIENRDRKRGHREQNQ